MIGGSAIVAINNLRPLLASEPVPEWVLWAVIVVLGVALGVLVALIWGWVNEEER